MRDKLDDMFSKAQGGFAFTEEGAELFVIIIKVKYCTGRQISELLRLFFIQKNGAFYLLKSAFKADKYGEWATLILKDVKLGADAEQYVVINAESVQTFIQNINRLSGKSYLATDFLGCQQNNLAPECADSLYSSIISEKLGLKVNTLVFDPESPGGQNRLSIDLLHSSSSILHQTRKKAAKGETWIILCRDSTNTHLIAIKNRAVIMFSNAWTHGKALSSVDYSAQFASLLEEYFKKSKLKIIIDKDLKIGDLINLWLHSQIPENCPVEQGYAAPQLSEQSSPSNNEPSNPPHSFMPEDASQIPESYPVEQGYTAPPLPRWLREIQERYSARQEYTAPQLSEQPSLSNIPRSFMPAYTLKVLAALSFIDKMQSFLPTILTFMPTALTDLVIQYAGIPDTIEHKLSSFKDVWDVAFPPKNIEHFKELLNAAFLFKSAEQYEMVIPMGYVNVPKDGHCFYHAVSRQVDMTAEELHNAAITEVLTHNWRYDGFVLGGLNPMVNAELEEGSRIWATHAMIQATANALGRSLEINMFNLDGTPTGQEAIHINPLYDTGEPALIIGNIADVHFITPSQ